MDKKRSNRICCVHKNKFSITIRIYNNKCVLIVSIECLLGRSSEHHRKSISFWKFIRFNWYNFDIKNNWYKLIDINLLYM